MNITKILCKSFDEYDKGYVTIGDILRTLPYIIGCILVIGTYLYGIYRWIFTGFSPYENPTSAYEYFTGFIMVSSALISCIILFIIIVVSVAWLYEQIEDIKVVSCKRDENEKK